MGSYNEEWFMRKEPEIFTRVNVQNVPVSDGIMDVLARDEMTESVLREFIRRALAGTSMLVEKSLTGRRLEKVAEQIAHEVVEYLIDPDLRQAFGQQGALKFQVDMELPETMVWLRSVFVEMTPHNNFNSSAAYEFDLGASDKQREDSDIVLRLRMPQDYEDEEIERFRVEIESDLRHELEHSGQPTDVLMDVQKKVPDSEIWKTIQRAEDYYTSQAEIPSYVSQMVLKSKRLGGNAADIIDRELYNIYATGLDEGYT